MCGLCVNVCACTCLYLTDLGSKQKQSLGGNSVFAFLHVSNQTAIRQVLHHQPHAQTTCKQGRRVISIHHISDHRAGVAKILSVQLVA